VLAVAKKSCPSAVEKSGVVEGLCEFREGLTGFNDDGARVVLGFRVGVGGELCWVNDVMSDGVEERDDSGAGAGKG
jgi:hypothetical protein